MIKAEAGIDKKITSIKQRLSELEAKTPSALAKAINQAAVKVKEEMAVQTQSRYNYRAVKSTVKISKATRQKLVGTATSKGPVIPLAKFKVSPSRAAVSGSRRPSVYKAAVKKGPATKPLNTDPKAFIAVMKSGHKGVFQRTGRWDAAQGNRSWTENSRQYKNGGRGRKLHSKHNEIIEEKFAPAVPWMIGNKDSMKVIRSEAESTLHKRMDEEIKNILGKGKT